MRKLTLSLMFAAAAMMFGATVEEAAACPTLCGPTKALPCGDGVIVYGQLHTSTDKLRAACGNGGGAARPDPRPRQQVQQRTETRQKVTQQRTIRQETTTTIRTSGMYRPNLPQCSIDKSKTNMKDYIRWEDNLLRKYGMTMMCDAQTGGWNLKGAKSSEPTRYQGSLIRFGGSRVSFGPKIYGSTIGEIGDKLAVESTKGTIVYNGWNWKQAY